MSPAAISLVALLLTLAISMVSRVNVGIVAIALAWLVGVLVGVDAGAVMAGFPASLFLTLAGVTLLFACAETNGTLEALAHRAVRAARGDRRLLPVLFFLIAFALSSVGPGAISSVALVAPLAMAIGERARLPHLLTALMVAVGANAGNLSPVSSVGVVANGTMAGVGLGGHGGKVWLANLAAHVVVGIGAYALSWPRLRAETGIATSAREAPGAALSRAQRGTVGVIGLWIVGVLALELPLALSAFVAAALLVLSRAAEERAVLRQAPWGVILMVCGVSLLVALLERTGGMELFTSLIARFATADTVNGVVALVTGAISMFSSTSGVVLPAFLPTAPRLVAELGGGDALAVALSINVGSALVDVSPLSTLGALCVAAVPDPGAAQLLFRRLLWWGASMILAGALLCQLFAGALARA
jgi:Na+/H+ antiporter NhaD/arsenite permease-like protein